MTDKEHLEHLAGRLTDTVDEITDILERMDWPPGSNNGGIWDALYEVVEEFERWVKEGPSDDGLQLAAVWTNAFPDDRRRRALFLPVPVKKDPAG